MTLAGMVVCFFAMIASLFAFCFGLWYHDIDTIRCSAFVFIVGLAGFAAGAFDD